MRIIDADALIDDMQERLCKPCKADGKDYHEVACRACWVDDAMGEIDSAPSIDICFCRECKHWNKAPNTERGWCDKCDGLVEPNFYCADGERKE